MADNTDFLPQSESIDPPHVVRNRTIIGDSNIVDVSSINTIVSGLNNFVGAHTKNINILGSTNCQVTSGVTNVNIINSSGVSVTESDTTYIKNVVISVDSFITSGVTFSQGYRIANGSVIVTLDDYTIEDPVGGSQVQLPSPVGHTQIFNVKLTGSTESAVIVEGGLFIDDSTQQFLTQFDNLTVQSNGSNKYIII